MILSVYRLGPAFVLVFRVHERRIYKLKIGTRVCKCTCRERANCSHAFYLLTNILKADIRDFGRESPMSLCLSNRFDRMLSDRMELPKTMRLREGEQFDCLICQDPIEHVPTHWNCPQCKNVHVHNKCLNKWFAKSLTCPFCRFGIHSRVHDKPDAEDPLALLVAYTSYSNTNLLIRCLFD